MAILNPFREAMEVPGVALNGAVVSPGSVKTAQEGLGCRMVEQAAHREPTQEAAKNSGWSRCSSRSRM